MKVTEIGRSNDPLEGMPSFDCRDLSDPQSIAQMQRWKEVWPSTFWSKKRLCICLSCCMSSMLMWGHYAASHTGVCLVFKLKDLRNISARIGLIHYSPQIRAKDYVVFHEEQYLTNFSKLEEAVMLTKIPEWSYEREVRIIFKDNTLCYDDEKILFTDLLMPYLDGIILGAKCSLTQKCVEDFIADSPLKDKPYLHIQKARISETEGKIETDIYGDLADELYREIEAWHHYAYIGCHREDKYYGRDSGNPCFIPHPEEKRLR